MIDDLITLISFSLEALDSNAYEAFKASKNLRDVVDRVEKSKDAVNKGGLSKKLSIRASLMTPVQPMLVSYLFLLIIFFRVSRHFFV